jgi:haloacetate dehalogenase
MFEGFADDRVDVGEVTLRVRHAGERAVPAVLLIHGPPRTGATWHRVAPQLVTAGYRVTIAAAMWPCDLPLITPTGSRP